MATGNDNHIGGNGNDNSTPGSLRRFHAESKETMSLEPLMCTCAHMP